MTLRGLVAFVAMCRLRWLRVLQPEQSRSFEDPTEHSQTGNHAAVDADHRTVDVGGQSKTCLKSCAKLERNMNITLPGGSVPTFATTGSRQVAVVWCPRPAKLS